MQITIGSRILAGKKFNVDIEMYDSTDYGLIKIHDDEETFWESYTWYFHQETLDERLNEIEQQDCEMLVYGNID